MNTNVPKMIAHCIMRLQGEARFWSVLALHADWIPDTTIETACTNGRTVRFNPTFLADLPPDERDFVVAHEVTHLALLHVQRAGERDPMLWNVACDVVVNGMLVAAGLRPVSGCIRDPSLEHLRAEDVYARIGNLSKGRRRKLGGTLGSRLRDLGPASGPAAADGVQPVEDHRAWWRSALRKAVVVQRQSGQGSGAFGSFRELAEVLEPQLDWRTLLWRYMVRKPTDFCGYDRRFIHQGLYVEELDGMSVDVQICIDTSGSVGARELADFLSEVRSILANHPHLDAQLWYADTKLYGPWTLEHGVEIPQAQGGGGTDLCPFFQAINKATHVSPDGARVAIYLTDGFGPIPEKEPEFSTLWIVPDGGRTDFPWGEVARLEAR